MDARQTIDSQKAMFRQIITLISIFAALGMNIWANIAPPKGMTIGEISNQLFGDILITPANYAFAIWGLIYLGLISFGIYQALPPQRYNRLLQRVGYGVTIASTAQIAWVFLFLYRQFALSFLAMLGILLPLIGAYLRLPFGRNSLISRDSYSTERLSRTQKLLIRNPISIYLAWISVATIVNGAIVLKSWGWNGGIVSSAIWTIVMLLIAALITTAVTYPRLDFVYAGVFVWTMVAIAIRNQANLIIAGVAIGVAIALILLLLSRSFVGNE
ncbi:MAG: tryptophan-rich sensory protein [Pleurocapsa sp.]